MGLKSNCPHCKRTNWRDDAARDTVSPCTFCDRPFLMTDAPANPVVGPPAGPTASSIGGSGGLGGLVVVVAVAVGLISLGVLPVSCGKKLPLVKNYYRQYCDECGGDGQADRSCRSCRGRGYFGGIRCQGCSGRGEVVETCAFCAGSGKKPAK